MHYHIAMYHIVKKQCELYVKAKLRIALHKENNMLKIE